MDEAEKSSTEGSPFVRGCRRAESIGWFLLSLLTGKLPSNSFLRRGIIGWAIGAGGNVDDVVKMEHHYATNKNQAYIPEFERILKRYGLTLNDSWNREELPHSLGRHCNEYHDWVLQNMQRAAKEAGNDKEIFLRLFDKYVKRKVRKNPEMIRKHYWRQRK